MEIMCAGADEEVVPVILRFASVPAQKRVGPPSDRFGSVSCDTLAAARKHTRKDFYEAVLKMD